MSNRRRAVLQDRIERLWLHNLPIHSRLIWSLLTPPAMLYATAAGARAAFYRTVRKRRAEIRVISVGNLTVGGNGKTPLALYLGRKLVERGIATGIVSRGYGGVMGGGAALLVAGDGKILRQPEEAGDEPVMLAKSFPGPVAIAKRRFDAIALLGRRYELQTVVVDDGYQHLRLHRDVNLLVINTEIGFGNGWTLPAGPMRERVRAIKRADAIVLLSVDRDRTGALTSRQLAIIEQAPRVFRGRIAAKSLIQSDGGYWRELPLALSGRRVIALSGIANARSFAAILAELDIELAGILEYPDHHVYDAGDWRNIADAARGGSLIITTEKDLVKLEKFPFARDSLYALRIEVAMGTDEEALLDLAAGPFGIGSAKFRSMETPREAL